MALFGIGQAIAVILWLLIKRRPVKSFALPALSFVGAGLITALLYLPMLTEVIGFFVADVVDALPSANAQIASANVAIKDTVRELAMAFGGFGAVGAILVLGTVGTLSYLRQSNLLLGLFLIPIPVIILATVLLDRPIFPRFFFFAAGFLVLIAVRGLFVVADVLNRHLRFPVKPDITTYAATALVVGVSAIAVSDLYKVPKQDYGAAAKFVLTQSAGHQTFTTGNTTDLPFNSYLGQNWPRLGTATELQEKLDELDALILITAFERYVKIGRPDFWYGLNSNCDKLKSFVGSVQGADIVVYRCGDIGSSS